MGFVNGLVRSKRFFSGALLIGIVVSLYMVFMYAPTERTMGVVQRIFYFHVASAWNGFLSFLVLTIASIMYLRSRKTHWNELARSAGEVGVLFTTLALITGSLWARPVWNVWWTWDPRLTTTMILWFIYVAYLLVQAAGDGGERQARFAAILGIVGFVDVPIVHMSAILWRSIHPVVVEPGKMSMPPEMLYTLIVSVLTFTALALMLIGQRTELGLLRSRLQQLKEAFR